MVPLEVGTTRATRRQDDDDDGRDQHGKPAHPEQDEQDPSQTYPERIVRVLLQLVFAEAGERRIAGGTANLDLAAIDEFRFRVVEFVLGISCLRVVDRQLFLLVWNGAVVSHALVVLSSVVSTMKIKEIAIITLILGRGQAEERMPLRSSVKQRPV